MYICICVYIYIFVCVYMSQYNLLFSGQCTFSNLVLNSAISSRIDLQSSLEQSRQLCKSSLCLNLQLKLNGSMTQWQSSQGRILKSDFLQLSKMVKYLPFSHKIIDSQKIKMKLMSSCWFVLQSINQWFLQIWYVTAEEQN